MMTKTLLFLILFTGVASVAFANSDTTLYYMKNIESLATSDYSENAIPANGKDDATFIRAIISPVEKSDTLYTVNDYFLSGKLKFTGKSSRLGKSKPTFDVKLQSASMEFFPNGHKRRIVSFEDNAKKGDIFEYFPNGRLNTIKSIPDVDMAEYRLLLKGITTDTQLKNYHKLIDSVTRIILKQCQDSTGHLLAENGNGKWVEYQNDYKTPFAEGVIKAGTPDGEWHGKLCDSITYNSKYRNGKLLEGKSHTAAGYEYSYIEEVVLPEFQGGVYGFGGYLARTIKYPADARERGEQGRVLLQCIINIDGTLSNIRVIRGVYKSIDAEAFRALAQSPGWMPARVYGIKTNFLYTVPVSFTIANDN